MNLRVEDFEKFLVDHLRVRIEKNNLREMYFKEDTTTVVLELVYPDRTVEIARNES